MASTEQNAESRFDQIMIQRNNLITYYKTGEWQKDPIRLSQLYEKLLKELSNFRLKYPGYNTALTFLLFERINEISKVIELEKSRKIFLSRHDPNSIIEIQMIMLLTKPLD